ncbi:MAG TPA: FAD-dependent oxidoreductase [Candidatus Limnocylindrales bacterium]|nr:FAD-dependent oxidoreductase [Candidatus Limnocylindrales bacterium]
MAEFPSRAKVVIIGAGIVGNSIAYHLAKLGWRDLLLIDKGPFPNPGGSTGHASNFIFLVDHNKEMAQLTIESSRQYEEFGVQTVCGGIEVARSETRMTELRRRMDSAKNWRIDDARLLTPAEVGELVPFIDTSILVGGFYTPGVSVVDSLRFGTMCRERAEEMGALTSVANTEVTGFDVEDEQIRAVHTTKGTVEAEYVVIACGVWSPKVAEMAGARIPLTPVVHQMADYGPVPLFEQSSRAIEYPIVRDMDVLMYERQDGIGLEVGSYAHRSILHDPEEIPSNEQAALSPTEFPFTQEDFDPQLEDALALMPAILGDERVGQKYAINGLIALTPDGMPLLGETPEVRGLWSAAAVWVKEGPAVGRCIAEWMVHGEPSIDVAQSDIGRFHAHQRTRQHTKARSFEAFPKTYGIVHPAEQYLSDRPLRKSPMHEWHVEHDAEFFEVAGWERTQWFNSNAGLVEHYGVETRPNEWDARWWSPIINAEHLAMREKAGIFDLSAFEIFDIVGTGALASVQKVAMRQMDVAVGKVVYTPVLSEVGGFKSDLTIMRLGRNHFRVVTGGAHGPADLKWFKDHLDEHASLVDLTTAYTTIGIWGPRARDIVQSLTRDDMSHAGFPFGTCRTVEIGSQMVLASRISYVGELGWELYVPIEQGRRLWEELWEAGKAHGLTACGMGVYGTTGRLEKGYRAYGMELDGDYDVVEAGMLPAKIKAEDFVGKAAVLEQMAKPPAAVLCTLTVDDHASPSTGERRFMLGRQPIVQADGTPITDAKGRRSYATSAGASPSTGKHVLFAYLPPDLAVEGGKLFVQYFMDRYPVTIAVVGARPLFDPDNARVRA